MGDKIFLKEMEVKSKVGFKILWRENSFEQGSNKNKEVKMRKRSLLLIVAFFSAQIFNFTPLFAETVILKTGQKIEGKIIKKTDAFIRIEENGIPMTYFNEEIDQVIETPQTVSGANPENEISKVEPANPADTKTKNTSITNTALNPTLEEDFTKNPEYTEIFEVVKNFFEHRNDNDLDQGLTSLAPEFKTAMLPEFLIRGKSATSRSADHFRIEDLEIEDDIARVIFAFKVSVKFLNNEKPAVMDALKQVILKKGSDGWKITDIEDLGSRGGGRQKIGTGK